jgi:hypothetical protein
MTYDDWKLRSDLDEAAYRRPTCDGPGPPHDLQRCSCGCGGCLECDGCLGAEDEADDDDA